eukprot:UN23924
MDVKDMVYKDIIEEIKSVEVPVKLVFELRKVCKYYSMGNCDRGDTCDWWHIKNYPMPPGSTENDGDGGRGGVDNPDDQSDTRICKFYLRGGKCYENDLCGYLHTKNVPNDIIYAISDAKYICKFFITKRGCKYAEQCRDKHIPFD